MLQSFYRAVLPEQGRYALFEGPRKRHVWCASLDELTRETERRADMPDLYFATASFCEPTERTIDNALYRRAFCFDIDAGPAKVAKHGLDKVYATRDDAIRAVVAWCKAAALAPAWIISSGAGLHVYFLLDQDAPVDDWLPVAKALKAKALAEGLKIDPAPTADAARILRPVGALHNNGERVGVLQHLDAAVYTLEALRAKLGTFAAPARERVRRLNDDVLDAPIGPPKLLSKIGKGCAAMAHAMQARGDVAEPYWRAMLGVIKHTVEGREAAHAYSEGHPDYDYHDTEAKFDRWTAGPATCAVFEGENPQACASCRHRGKVKSPAVLGAMTDKELEERPELKPDLTPKAAPTQSEPEEFSAFGATDDDDEPTAAPAAPASTGGDPWDGHIPDTFRVLRTATGIIMVQKRASKQKNDEGQDVTIWVDVQFSAVAFWFEFWAPSTATDEAQAVMCLYDAARRNTYRHTIPTRLISTRSEVFGALAAHNVQVFPNTKTAKDTMEDYISASIQKIRDASQRHKIAERFGTNFTPRGDVVVAQGRHIISKDGSIFEGVVSDELKQRSTAYRVPLPQNQSGTWTPEVWGDYIMPRAKRHIEYLREFYSDSNFRPYQLAIMLAWGSPMLAFIQGNYKPGSPLPGIGLTVSLYSPKSGIGKTAAMHAAALAFGLPGGVVMQLDDTSSTDNARQALLVQAGTMPSFMDEMENVRPAALAGFISAVGNGAPKQRMRKNLTLAETSPIALVNMMSTNKSHREIVSADRNESTAVQMRMLEIECSNVAPVSLERANAETQARAGLIDCAGAVGAVLHYAMCRVGADRLNQLGLKCAEDARAALAGRQDGRFMWRCLGAMLAARTLLRLVGLDVFDDQELIAEFRYWHDAGYEFASDQMVPEDGAGRFAMMLSDLMPRTLITRTETTRRPGVDGTSGEKMDIPLNDRIPDDVQARSVLDWRYVYVRTDAIKEWASKRQVGYLALMAAGKQAGVFDPPDPDKPKQVTRKIDLFKGTKLAQGVRPTVVKIWLDKVNGIEGAYERQAGTNVRELRPRQPDGGEQEAGREAS